MLDDRRRQVGGVNGKGYARDGYHVEGIVGINYRGLASVWHTRQERVRGREIEEEERG